MGKTQVAVIGAGPAGLACAVEIARYGGRVTVLDENKSPGGQLFKQIHKFFGSQAHQAGTRGIDIGCRLLEQVGENGAEVLLDAAVYGIYDNRSVAYVKDGKENVLEAKRIVIAAGASENPLAFPGSTMPGVMGAGAAQTLINICRVLPGQKVLMVGSGNVGLIVSYQLLQAGARVVALLEAAPEIGGYGVHASKLKRAGVPIYTSHTIKELTGAEKVEKAVVVKLDSQWNQVKGTEKHLDVDTVCIAVGLSPLTELCWLCGCEFIYLPSLGGHVPKHDENQETSVKGLYAAGDVTGIEEASSAMEEGRLAGLACAESLGLLSGSEANKLKAAVRARLSQLRAGPFGEARQKAKDEQTCAAVRSLGGSM